MGSLRAVLSIAASLLVACQGDQAPPRPFDGAQAFSYIESQLAFGPRIPGTPEHEAAGRWLDSLMRERADVVVVQDWIHVSRGGDSLPMRNVMGRFNPDAPTRILFLAHWDTRPKADGPKSSDPDAPVPGANDGGSGVAVILGIADALRAMPPTTGVDLLLVDGEDYGVFAEKDDVLIGSKYFVEHLPDGGASPRYAILLDLVGDMNQRFPKEGNSLIGAPDVVKDVWRAARRIGYGHVFVDVTGQSIVDDHIPLQQAGIPAINIIDFDYPHWHTPEDTIDKISAASLQVVGEVALEMIHQEEGRK
jgi:hypothetical protein